MKKISTIALGLITVGVAVWFARPYLFKEKIKNEISLSINNQIKSFDPANAFDDDSLSVLGQSLDTLYQYHYLKRPYEVIPSLAEGMPTISKDGRVYTIKLKKDIYYHMQTKFFKEKRAVKAQDFVLQIKRLAFKPLKSVGKSLFSGKIKGFDSFANKVGNDFDLMLKTPMAGLSAPDDNTLRIELINPDPNILYFLSMTFTAPVPEELLVKYQNDLSEVILGTGAYYLKSYSASEYIFERNLEYRNEVYPSSGDRYANTQKLLTSSTQRLPFIDKVYFKIISNENKRWDSFLNGSLDVLSVPKSYLAKVSSLSKEFEELKKDKYFDVKYFTTISSRWLGFNMQDPILGKNLFLRKAIAHAINYDKYIEILTNNTNLKANSILNPSISGYQPGHQKPYSYDLDLAKKYLKKSKINIDDFSLTYSTRGTQQVHFNEAQFIKEQLAALGIKLKIEVLEFSQFIKKGRAGEMQFFTDQWIYDYPDAENVLQLLISKNSPGINKSGYRNKEVDQLYEQLAITLDKDSRVEIMYKIEKIVEQDLPWVMLMYESSYILHSKHIQNFRKSFFIRNFLKYLKKK